MSFIGLLIIISTTRWGIGVSPDSTIYIESARNIVNGHGYALVSNNNKVSPITHFPPLFSLIISLFAFLGMDVLEAARLLNSFIFVANIYLAGIIIKKYTGGFLWGILYAQAIIISSVGIIKIHSMAWTEPLFILLSVFALHQLANYFETKKKYYLYISSAAMGLSCLTRDAGMAVVATGIIGILFIERNTFSMKLKDLLIFLCIFG